MWDLHVMPFHVIDRLPDWPGPWLAVLPLHRTQKLDPSQGVVSGKIH